MIDADQQNNDLLLNNNNLLDHTSIDDFIIFLYFCTDIIKFPHKKDNYWEKFLISDNVVIYSLILHTDTNLILKNFSKDVLSFSMIKDINDKLHILDNILKSISDILTICIYWYENLTDIVIKNDIEDFLSKTIHRVQLLSEIIKSYQIKRSDEINLFFDFVEKKLENFPIDIQHSSELLSGDVNNSITILTREINENSLLLILKLQKKIPDLIDNELYNGSHDNHITLLFTYFLLMKKVGAKVNQITNRHLEYYYKGVLDEKRQGVVYDKTLVFCDLIGDSQVKTLYDDVSIFGGQDDAGNDVIFKTDESIDIYRGIIDTIYTLEVSDITISSFDKLPNVSLKVAEYAMQDVYKKHELLYLFSPKRSKSLHLQDTKFNDNCGMVISSHSLFLQEGDRTINLKFHAIQKSLDKMYEQAKKYGLYKDDTTLQILTSLFVHSVQFQYSTPEGWNTIHKDNVKSYVDKDNVILSLFIDYESPSFTVPENDINYKYENPAIKIICPSDELLGCAILFLNLQFDSLEIEVDVKGCKNLILQNDLGVIENKISFQPFGSMPMINSSFYIGSQEIFNKKLDSLNINIEWENLPKDGGFIKYYKNYPNDINGNSFVANVYSLRHQKWVPVTEEKIQVKLFDSEINDDRSYEEISNNLVIDQLDLQALDLKDVNQYKKEQESYTYNTQDGFIKFELAGPDIAFGHLAYPKLIANSNAIKNKYIKKMMFDDVNEPYTPTIKNISIDYTSSIEYKFDGASIKDNRFFSISKKNIFGEYKELFDKNRFTFFDFAKSAYSLVHIGLKDIVGDKYVSFYIKIDEASVKLDSYTAPVYCYLDGNTVCPLSKDDIIDDETLGLKKSGKIVIKFPKNITKGTLLDNNLHWFSIMFNNTSSLLPTILGIYTNPVEVMRSSNNTSFYINPYTLTGIIDNGYSDINIYQPFESFGGKQAEDDNDLYKRVSERLRHKDRAVTAWDYEHLILSKFPQISRVKCINNGKIEDGTANNVTIVVLNTVNEYVENGRLFPQVSQTALEQIKLYIQQKTSAFADVKVINPVYEKIKFSFYLKIKPNFTKEQCIQDLNDTLKMYISPWLYRNNKEDNYSIEIGKEINTSDVINFINSQKYVEGISNFVGLKYDNNKITDIIKETNIIKPKHQWSIFYTSTKQLIKVVDANEVLQSKNLSGVDNFEIENDFVVGPINFVQNNNYNSNKLDITEENSVEDYYVYMKL